MQKKEFLQHFQGIEANQKINISPVPYKHKGSTYDEDGIRITGSKEFIDSILSRVKDLLNFENGTTRLQCVYKESVDRETQVPLDSWNCYLQVHQRGGEAIFINELMSARLGKETIVSKGY